MSEANCPNCGAPIRKPVCEYCGTLLADGGLVEHSTVEFYTDDGLYLVIDRPEPSEEMKGMIAAGIISAIEARKILYG